MDRTPAAHRWLPGLFFGDIILVLLFVALGMFSHLTWNGIWSLFPAAFPFLLAWVVWGLALGVFRANAVRSISVAVRSALVTWALAVPTAIFLRMWMLGRWSHWTFFVVAFASGGLILILWRGFAAWIAGRRQPVG